MVKDTCTFIHGCVSRGMEDTLFWQSRILLQPLDLGEYTLAPRHNALKRQIGTTEESTAIHITMILIVLQPFQSLRPQTQQSTQCKACGGRMFKHRMEELLLGSVIRHVDHWHIINLFNLERTRRTNLIYITDNK